MPLSTKIECGKFRHRIIIVAPSGVQDSFGGVVSGTSADWTAVLTCWAQIEGLSARDAAAAGTFVSTVSHRVTIRYPRDLTPMIGPNNQIWYRGRVFIIQGVVNPDETNKMLYLNCLEVAVATPPSPNPSLVR